jgi:ubiquinone/menaquinone biosynthesis C-methylase UbiE
MSLDASQRNVALPRRPWDRKARLHDVCEWPIERMALARWRRRVASLVTGLQILEAGVATGRNLPYYGAGQNVDAIDFSPAMLARAKQRRTPAHVTLHLMDVEALGFRDETFDSVVALCVFCSVPDPVRGLQEIRRVLRWDGRAVLLEPMRPGSAWLGPLFDRLDPLVSRFGPHINRRTTENILGAGLWIEQEENLLSDAVKLIVARR